MWQFRFFLSSMISITVFWVTLYFSICLLLFALIASLIIFLPFSHSFSSFLYHLFSLLFSLTSTLLVLDRAGEALLYLHYHSFSLALSFSIYFESCHYSSLLRFLTCQAGRYQLARLVHASSQTLLCYTEKQAGIVLTPTWTSSSSSVSTLLEGRSSSPSYSTSAFDNREITIQLNVASSLAAGKG